VTGILPAGRRWLVLDALRENGDGETKEEEDAVMAGALVGAAAMAAAGEATAAEEEEMGRRVMSE
jgi:hypothetical protein